MQILKFVLDCVDFLKFDLISSSTCDQNCWAKALQSQCTLPLKWM